MNSRKFLLLVGFLAVVLISGCGGGSSTTSAEDSSKAAEKSWVRAHLDDVYLWYNEIVDVPSASYPEAADYFTALLVRSKDRFSFSMPQSEAENWLESGMETGLGVIWGWEDTDRVFAYYVDPNSPSAGTITRGTEIISVNGEPVSDKSSSSLNAIFYPSQAGAATSMVIRHPGSSNTRQVVLVSSNYSVTTASQPMVLTLPNVGKVGYLLFNQHLLTSEQLLVNAMAYFKQQGVSEVVLDLRYNGGGYLDIAEEVASMLGGAPVQGKVFVKELFNDKHPEKTNNPSYIKLFGGYDTKGILLPQLDISRVFVLTGSNTCSASEAVINGLLPHMQVIRIGKTTCGKPYGFIQANHSQRAYFAIQIEAVNANGQNDYKSGFAPTCQISDDLNYPLGDSREARLNAALYYIEHNACPEGSKIPLPKPGSSDAAARGDVQLLGQRPALMILQ